MDLVVKAALVHWPIVALICTALPMVELAPSKSPVAHGQNPAYATYLTGGGFQIQPTATGIVHLSCNLASPLNVFRFRPQSHTF